MAEPLSRVDKLRVSFAAAELDAFLTLNPANQRWLTGWQQVFDGEPAHAALITTDAAYIHTDTRYSGAMCEQADQIWQISDERISQAKYIAQICKQTSKKLRLGIEDNLPMNSYRALIKELNSTSEHKVELVETTAQILKLRAVKDQSELELLRKAQSITDKAFSQILGWLKAGQTELEVANYLEFTLRNLGSQGLAFPSIVASGPNSAKPHAVPTNRQLQAGDLVVLDFGARYLDYCADMTRTVCIGQASSKQKDIYSAVLEAHNQAKATIKAGIKSAQAHDLAVSILANRGYEKQFLHSLGHGVGIEVHELPNLNPKNDSILETGNIVTVEPGVYLADYGGVRIEDYGLVTADDFDSFTLSSRDLIAI